MPVVKGLGWTFDTVAKSYEKLRPGYPEELYRVIFAYARVGEGTRAVEVGIGGGQATAPFLETGCRVEAVEPGENFASLLREKLGAYPGFSVRTARFEDTDFPPESLDLVYSASTREGRRPD